MESYRLYSEIEQSTDVIGASPHRLIQLLFNKFLVHIALAKTCINDGNIKRKHVAIAKAMDIIVYLKDCIDARDASTQEIAGLLSTVYSFIQTSIFKASIENNIQYLVEVEVAIEPIKSGWDKIG